MPQRFLRPGLRNSERWNAIGWMDQSFFIRLLTLVDDYGRHDGRVAVLWAECFAIWNQINPTKAIGLPQMPEILQRVAASSCKLIEWYEAEGKQVVQVCQWQERVREGVREKWPAKTPKSVDLAASCSNSCRNLLPSSPSSPSPSPPSVHTHSVSRKPVGQPAPELKECVRELVKDKRVQSNGIAELKSLLCVMYKRSETAPWDNFEEHLLVDISKRPDWHEELEIIKEFRFKLTSKRFFPQKLSRLLEEWNGTLDRARRAKTSPSLYSTI